MKTQTLPNESILTIETIRDSVDPSGSRVLKYIWYSFFFLLTIFSLICGIFGSSPFFANLLFIFHSLLTCLIIIQGVLTSSRVKLLISFILRLGLMFWDIYFSHIFPLPNSGRDSIDFFNASVNVANNISLLSQPIYGGPYTKINGILFFLVGESKILGQYINVLLGISIIILIYEICLQLDFSKKTIKMAVSLCAFAPMSMILSALFLREMFSTFFVALSLYYFVHWFTKAKFSDMTLCFAALAISSLFHSGVFVIIFGYIFAFMFYDKDNEKIKFTLKTVLIFILANFIIAMLFIYANDIFFAKFMRVDSYTDILQVANQRSGGSAYLSSMKMTSLRDFLSIKLPIKVFYFYASPLPWDWRNLSDLVTFLLDSVFYAFIPVYVLCNMQKSSSLHHLQLFLFLSWLGFSLIFGVGVSNAGAAMRHRNKALAIFILMFAIAYETRTSQRTQRTGTSINKN